MAVRGGAPARGVQRVRAVAVARVRRVRRRVLRLLVRGPAGGARALPKEARALFRSQGRASKRPTCRRGRYVFKAVLLPYFLARIFLPRRIARG